MTKSKKSIEEEILPGIGLLSEKARQQFIGTEVWYLFNKIISELSAEYNAPLFLNFNVRNKPPINIPHKIKSFIEDVQHTTTYADLKQSIIKETLIRFYPTLTNLSKEQFITIASTEYSKALFCQPVNEHTKHQWLSDFKKDKSPQVLDILETARIDIIREELKKCYPYYVLLSESEQIILAQKTYSTTIFFSYPTSIAKTYWLTLWNTDDSSDALKIKAKEQQYNIHSRIKDFYWHYSYLDQNERSILAKTPYSLALLNKEKWLTAFSTDNSPDIIAIREKEKIRIIKNKIQEYCPETIYLNDKQRLELARTWYSQKLLPPHSMCENEWKQALANDNQESIQRIKKIVNDEYQYHLGFLFKNPQPDWQNIVREIYSDSIDSQQKISLLSNRLGKDWAYENTFLASMNHKMENSLMYFLKSPMQDAQKYANDIANAHAVYRFFGMSSENIVLGLQFELGERPGAMPVANLLDLYNYHRNRKTIAEGLNILKALSIPLNLFFDEYFEIGRFENNPLKICIRAFVPFVVMAILLTLGYSLVLPLATHVFLEYLLFIPSVYLSIAGASLYLHVRNEAYTSFMSWFYNGHFNSPLFLANQRLRMAFREEIDSNTEHSTAYLVSKYYANKFEECEKMEEAFSKSKTIVDSNDLKLYKHYSKLKFDLYIEWYDIHERKDVPIDEIPKIVQNRLAKDHIVLLKQIRSSHKDYIDKYSTHYLTFFSDERNKTLRDQSDFRKNKLIEVESLTSKIDEVIKGWDVEVELNQTEMPHFS
jgi:hypothetical protein